MLNLNVYKYLRKFYVEMFTEKYLRTFYVDIFPLEVSNVNSFWS